MPLSDFWTRLLLRHFPNPGVRQLIPLTDGQFFRRSCYSCLAPRISASLDVWDPELNRLLASGHSISNNAAEARRSLRATHHAADLFRAYSPHNLRIVILSTLVKSGLSTSTLLQPHFLNSKPYIKPCEILSDPGTLACEFIITAKLLPLFLESDP